MNQVKYKRVILKSISSLSLDVIRQNDTHHNLPQYLKLDLSCGSELY